MQRYVFFRMVQKF